MIYVFFLNEIKEFINIIWIQIILHVINIIDFLIVN